MSPALSRSSRKSDSDSRRGSTRRSVSTRSGAFRLRSGVVAAAAMRDRRSDPAPKEDDVRKRRFHPRRRLPLLVGLLVMATLLVLPAAASADETELVPIVFVHGGAGSGAQYETQARRFSSNGYPASAVYAFEYDSSFATNTFAQVISRLDTLVDELRAEYGVDGVYLLGHSLGTTVSNLYLSVPARAAKVAKYVGIDGASNTSSCLTTPTLSCLGIFQGTNTTGNVGNNNVRLSPQTHVQVATSAESFAAQYEFFTGGPPATTLVLPEPPGQVRISGRAVLFPQNVGPAEATLEVWEVDDSTGHRKDSAPHAVLTVAPDGSWGRRTRPSSPTRT